MQQVKRVGLARAFAGGLALLATAAAFAQSTVTVKSVDADTIDGAKRPCPAQVTFTGHLQVKLGNAAKAVKVRYQWVRSDGKTVGPLSMTAGPGDRPVTYNWSVTRSSSGSVQLVILEPAKQSGQATFRLDCSKSR